MQSRSDKVEYRLGVIVALCIWHEMAVEGDIKICDYNYFLVIITFPTY